MTRGSAARPSQLGFTYLALLIVVAVIGAALATVGPLWSDAVAREREAQALRIGAAYASAIADYYAASPGSAKELPPSLVALLEDTRFVGTVRHLRRLYGDPLQNDQPWVVLKTADGRIRGVASASVAAPFHQGRVELDGVSLDPARRYADWQFTPRSLR